MREIELITFCFYAITDAFFGIPSLFGTERKNKNVQILLVRYQNNFSKNLKLLLIDYHEAMRN